MRPAVEQVADKPAHVIGLLFNDPEHLLRLGRVQRRRGFQHCARGALDGRQRRAQFVAHQSHELRPGPLQFFECGQILQGDNRRECLALRGADRRDVNERLDAAPVRHRKFHFLGAHGVQADNRNLAERDFTPVLAATRDRLRQLLRRVARHVQPFHDPYRCPIERHRPAVARVEHHHAYGRGFHERLEMPARLLFVVMRTRIRDGGGGLGCKQHEHLLVLARERFLSSQEETADMRPPISHRRALEGPCRHQMRGESESLHVSGQILQPHYAGEVAEVFEKPQPVRPLLHPHPLLFGEPVCDEYLWQSGFVECGDNAVTGARQLAGAVHNFLQHDIHIEARAYTQNRRAQSRHAFAQRVHARLQIFV